MRIGNLPQTAKSRLERQPGKFQIFQLRAEDDADIVLKKLNLILRIDVPLVLRDFQLGAGNAQHSAPSSRRLHIDSQGRS